MDVLKTYIICRHCGGTKVFHGQACGFCGGDGMQEQSEQIDITDLMTTINTLTTKVDAIKTMLDSQTIGLQKMSSNLDDIMVKLDV